MGTLEKVFLSYAAWFGGAITLLTVCGQWELVNRFLVANPILGLSASVLFLMFSYIHYDSVDKVAKLEFDKRRRPRKGRRK